MYFFPFNDCFAQGRAAANIIRDVIFISGFAGISGIMFWAGN